MGPRMRKTNNLWDQKYSNSGIPKEKPEAFNGKRDTAFAQPKSRKTPLFYGSFNKMNEPVGTEKNNSLSDENLLDIYRQMVLCRTLDERIWALNRQGKAAIVASSQGD